MPRTTKEDIDDLRDNIDKLDRTLACADENGLFKNCKNDNCSLIASNVVAAYKDLKTFSGLKDEEKEKNLEIFSRAWQSYRLAYHQLNQSINNADPLWRFKYLLGGPFLIYLITLLGITFFAWLLLPDLVNSEIFWVPAYAYMWGFIGGILQGLWYLWQHTSDRKFRCVWLSWYLLLPFMGAILGALTYLVFYAGFFATTGIADIKSEAFIILICAIAGFSTLWAVKTLNEITSMINIGKQGSTEKKS